MEIQKIEDVVLLAGSREYVLEGVSRTVSDHEVQMGQRECEDTPAGRKGV